MTISVTGSRARSSFASSLDLSTSPPLQETPRAQDATVASEDVESRTAPSARALRCVVALAAHLPGHDLVTQADPTLDRPLSVPVLCHFLGFSGAASRGPGQRPAKRRQRDVTKTL